MKIIKQPLKARKTLQKIVVLEWQVTSERKGQNTNLKWPKLYQLVHRENIFRMRLATAVAVGEPGKQSRWVGGTKLRYLCWGAKHGKIVMFRQMESLFTIILAVKGSSPPFWFYFIRERGRGGEGERGGMRLSQTQASFTPTDKVSNISFSNSIPQWNIINSWKCIINYGIVKPEHLSSHNRVRKFKFCKHFPKVMRMSAIYTSFQKFKTRNSGKIH